MLGKLCCDTAKLLHDKPADLSKLKLMLGMSFPELKEPSSTVMSKGLVSCSSIEEVIEDVIRPRITLAEYEYLESIFTLFQLEMHWMY